MSRRNTQRYFIFAFVVVLMLLGWFVVKDGLFTARDNNSANVNQSQQLPTDVDMASGAPSKADLKALNDRVIAFHEALWLLQPEDNTETRQARVAPFVTPNLLPKLDLGVCTDCYANEQRINSGVTRIAIVNPDSIAIEELDGAFYVSITGVTIRQLNEKGGTMFEATTTSPNTVWLYVNGEWKAYDTF